MNENFVEREEFFGFHSEYYIYPEWWKGESCSFVETMKGYTTFSEYKNDIYYLCNYGKTVVQFNPAKQTAHAIKMENKEDYCFLAVNCHGYFLYNEQSVTLYGFDGEKKYTHKFQKKKPECIYIYDSKVFYSDTKGTHSAILCVDMLTKEVRTIWSMDKGDTVFDRGLRDMYVHKYGEELPFFPNPSNVGMSCRFLYANAGRIIAGYVRCKGSNTVSYILNIDIRTQKRSIIDCFAFADRYHRPLMNDKFVFSFNMQNDTVWEKFNEGGGGQINLACKKISENLENMRQEHLKNFLKAPDGGSRYYYYFDGSSAYAVGSFDTIRLSFDGEKYKFSHPSTYQTDYFWSFGDIYIVPDSNKICFYNTSGKEVYSVNNGWQLKELIESAKPLQPNKPRPSAMQNHQTTEKQVLQNREADIMPTVEKECESFDSSAAVVIFGEAINEKNAADAYVQVIRRILERYPSLVGEWEAGITYDANRYTGSHKTIQLDGMTVYINTGNNTNVKRKNLQKLLQMAGVPADQVRFYE